jgi:phosphoribosyl 1,2-cyclic phosphate phosphodiesterase
MKIKVLFLGTGTSSGIPAILCSCPVCRSENPKNKRLRSSILVTVGDKNILVDTATDLREQALRYDIRQIDAILFTHSHADHVHGIDEVRIYSFHSGEPISCYGNEETIETIHRQFPYIFVPEEERKSFIPRINTHIVNGAFELFGQEIIPIPIRHGSQTILGYRLGPFAYLSDCNGIPEESVKLLEGLDLLILDALRHRPHPTHFSLEQSIETARRIDPNRTLFTHMAHQLEHEESNRNLPDNMALAFDGQVVEFHTAPSPDPSVR